MTPSCGQCRYPTVGLTSLTCPECGNDLRQVGINVSNSALPPAAERPWAHIVVFTMLVLVLGIATTTIVGDLVPKRWSVVQTLTLAPPSAVGAWHIVLTASADGFGDGVGSGRLPVVVRIARQTGPGPGATLTAEVVEGRSTVVDAAGNSTALPVPVDSLVVGRWLAAAGYGLSAVEVDQLCLAIGETSWPVEPRLGDGSGGEYLDAPPFQQSMIASVRHRRPQSWVVAVGTVLWVAMWLAGLARFARPRSGRVTSTAT